MNENVSLTTILGIGERTYKVLDYIRVCMREEEPDLQNNYFAVRLNLCHYCYISTSYDLTSDTIKNSIKDIPICFLIVDAYDSKSINYVYQFNDYIHTLECGLSIVMLLGNSNSSLKDKSLIEELCSHVDSVIELGNLTEEDIPEYIMVYNIIRGINSMLVKPSYFGFDVADLYFHLKSSGILKVAWSIENAKMNQTKEDTVSLVTQSAFIKINKQLALVAIKKLFIFIEGSESVLDLINVQDAIHKVINELPESTETLYVAVDSKTIGDDVRVLIGASL